MCLTLLRPRLLYNFLNNELVVLHVIGEGSCFLQALINKLITRPVAITSILPVMIFVFKDCCFILFRFKVVKNSVW